MWILRKVQESAESLPVEFGRLVSKNREEISAKANLLNKLHNNVLTPDKIPDFFLPPRLSRRPLLAVEGVDSHGLGEPDATVDIKTDLKTSVKGHAKPIPFSLKSYESGLFESPNTRRKESLFHSAFTNYTLERVTARAVPKLPSIALLKVSSLESETSSSADSSPRSSPPPSWPIRRKREDAASPSPSASKGSLFKEVVLSSRNEDNKVQSTSPKRSSAVHQPNCSSLSPPLHFHLDMLHCQERLHSEHVLLLPHRGSVRLSASRSSAAAGLTTVRVRVISVEGLREPGDPRPLNCGLSLSLSPGKLQRQHSATIRNCRNPVFNEDFFFTEAGGEEGGLRELALRVKVLDKTSSLGRAVVLGVVVKPLTQLLPL